MKEKLVIIGANDFQNQLICRAKQMGYETHVFAWKEGAVGEKTADYFYPISIVEKDEILEKCKQIQPIGVISIASDLAMITVNYVAEKLGLVCNPTKITDICTNKFYMRQAMEEMGVPTPKYVKVTDIDQVDISQFTYPIIVKPTDRSGSRSITKLYNADGINSAVENAISSSFEKAAIIEEYIEGEEYSCECVSYKGTHNFLAFTRKFTTGSPNYIETGHMQPADIDEKTQQWIVKEVFQALDALGIQNGASHTEFKLKADGTIGIIEIGARMGGDCIGSDLVQLSTGQDFVKMVIDIACGKEPDIKTDAKGVPVKIQFLFNEDDIRQLEDLKRENQKCIYRISEIQMNGNSVTDSSSRLGYYIYFTN